MEELGKIVDYNKKVERLAVNEVEKQLIKQDIYVQNYETIPDTGIDALAVMYHVPEDVGDKYNVFFEPNRNFHIQIKGMNPEKRKKYFYDDGSPKRRIEVIHLNTWINEEIPVILTLTDLENNDAPITYWLHIQEDLGDETKRKIVEKHINDIEHNQSLANGESKKISKHTIKFDKKKTIDNLRKYLINVFQKLDFKIKLDIDPETLSYYTRLPHFSEIRKLRISIQNEFEKITLRSISNVIKHKEYVFDRGKSKFGLKTNVPKVDLAHMPWSNTTVSGGNILPIAKDVFDYYEVYEYDKFLGRTGNIIDLSTTDIKFDDILSELEEPVILMPSFNMQHFLDHFDIQRSGFKPPLIPQNIEFREVEMYKGEFNSKQLKIINYYPRRYEKVESVFFKKLLEKKKGGKWKNKFGYLIIDSSNLELNIKLPDYNDDQSKTDVVIEFHTKLNPTDVKTEKGIKTDYDYFDFLLYVQAELKGKSEKAYFLLLLN